MKDTIPPRPGKTRKAQLNRVARRARQTMAQLEGLNLPDPNRADRMLRRFSWEDAPE